MQPAAVKLNGSIWTMTVENGRTDGYETYSRRNIRGRTESPAVNHVANSPVRRRA